MSRGRSVADHPARRPLGACPCPSPSLIPQSPLPPPASRCLGKGGSSRAPHPQSPPLPRAHRILAKGGSSRTQPRLPRMSVRDLLSFSRLAPAAPLLGRSSIPPESRLMVAQGRGPSPAFHLKPRIPGAPPDTLQSRLASSRLAQRSWTSNLSCTPLCETPRNDKNKPTPKPTASEQKTRTRSEHSPTPITTHPHFPDSPSPEGSSQSNRTSEWTRKNSSRPIRIKIRFSPRSHKSPGR